MDKPVVILRPAPNTVIENLNLDGTNLPPQSGIYINCYPTPAGTPDANYVCQGLIIRNNKINGFQQNITIIGPQRGTQVYGNTVTNATEAHGNDAHGMYFEGLQLGCQIHDNIIANNGWWASYDVNDPVQRTQANRHHGIYMNESAGMDDTTQLYNNIIIDSAGSNVGCRHSLRAWNNVFRPGGDWDLIVGQYGVSPATLVSNACFAPRKDAVPYYGGGIHLLCPGLVAGNLYSNTAATTYNAAAVTEPGSVIVPQIGVWPKPGCTTRPTGSRVPTIEDFCLVTYGKADVAMLRPGDAPKIVAWLGNQLVTPPIVIVPGPAPAPIGSGSLSDGTKFDLIQKP